MDVAHAIKMIAQAWNITIDEATERCARMLCYSLGYFPRDVERYFATVDSAIG